MKKLLTVAIAIVALLSTAAILFANPVEAQPEKLYEGASIDFSLDSTFSYADYLNEYGETYPQQTIVIDALDYVRTENTYNSDDVYVGELDGVEGLYIPESVNATWSVDIQEEGFYNIKIDYSAISGRSSAITRGILIDNEYPFEEAQLFTLSRIWEDEFEVSTKRVQGEHDLKPAQIEKERWNTELIRDNKGYYNGNDYYFHFTPGTHEITFVQDREPVLVKTITLFQKQPAQSYDEVLQDYLDQGLPKIQASDFPNGNDYVVQGENSYEKSSPILGPVANWSSYKVDPYEKFIMRYNTIGGITWRVPGDWISWVVVAPKSGLYHLTFKINQNYSQGVVATRILRINGEVPFEEARTVEFNYDSDWQNITLGRDGLDYWFYLEEGQNVISMENTIGVYNNIILNTERIVHTLNWMYRQIVMITGMNPDQYQDYMLYSRIDDLAEMIDESISGLESAIDEIVSITGNRSSFVAAFEKTLYLLREFKKSETNIQTKLNELDEDISALGTWIMDISEQPLSIDCIYLHGETVELKKASTNIFQKFWHELVMLFGSYGANTSLESNVSVDGPTITVWIMTGKDQSQLLRQLIDEQFSVQHNVNVELKLVLDSALLPATLSGNGPDVALGVGQNIPVNWGIRNAVLDLTMFSDFDEVAARFHPSAITPFLFRDSVYALPDTEDFLVSFVRKDIVEELGVEVPTNWDEVINLLPGLQRQYLDYYLPNTKGGLSTLMYAMIVQHGGKLYEDDGKSTLLLEDNAQQAFIDFTTFFSDFGFAISASFPNRFRSGEMPIGIYNFSLYNTLSVFAPEIRGQWEFAPLPGYMIDGVLHNETTATSSGTVILADSKEKEASWEFVKWWLSAEGQTGYARGMEAILGAAARYPTANLEAFANLPWSVKDYQLLTAQRENAVGVPTVPGDYIIGRYIDNAFRSTVNNNTNPRDNLFKYVTKINIELERKRQEFNLD